MSEVSDSRELTVLVFMTRSLAGTVAATKTSGPLQAVVHVAALNERSGRNVVGTGVRRLLKSAVHQHGVLRSGKNHKSFAHMECTCE